MGGGKKIQYFTPPPPPTESLFTPPLIFYPILLLSLSLYFLYLLLSLPKSNILMSSSDILLFSYRVFSYYSLYPIFSYSLYPIFTCSIEFIQYSINCFTLQSSSIILNQSTGKFHPLWNSWNCGNPCIYIF